jgi:DNA-binding NtrC family response regulator
MNTILISTEMSQTRDTIRNILSNSCRIHFANTHKQLWNAVDTIPCDCLFIDLRLLDQLLENAERANGTKSLLNKFKMLRPLMAIVLIVDDTDIRKAVSYLKNGASNYIIEPVNEDEIRLVLTEIERERHQQSEIDYLREQTWQDDSLDILQTLSPAMKRVYSNIQSVGPTKTTVLLLGETGTGKSHMAKRIHRLSNRKHGPFINVHCGAIPDTLIESELFGHEKGSFTGAHRRKLGKFEVASGGTIFLDEIGTISKSAQIKLLTILQEGIYQRVGGEHSLTSNVRVIAASNTDLKEMCAEGLFRKDLYYRLNVFPITIPQLHERKEDIPLFIEAFIHKFNDLNSKNIQCVKPDVIQALEEYDWPGNIRELENLMERAFILEMTSELTRDSFPSELFDNNVHVSDIPMDNSETLAVVRKKGLEEIERRYLHGLLHRNKGKINLSASEAGMGPRQLNKLMHKYSLNKMDYKSIVTKSD